MDVVACLTSIGQDIVFLDNDRFAHATARGLCIYDTTKGPREMIWRHEQGISCFVTHTESAFIIFAGMTACDTLEIVRLNNDQQPVQIPNPAKCAIIHMDISREANKLYGLSTMIDHRLTIWGLEKSPQVLISQKLDIICKRVVVNPVDANLACIYGSDGLRIVTVYEVFGQISVQIDSVREIQGSGSELQQQQQQQPSLDAFSSDIAFCIWLPYNRILVVTVSRDAYEVSVETKEGKLLGKFMDPVVKGPKHEVVLSAACATLTTNHLIIGTHDGQVCWYPLLGLLRESPSVEGNFFCCPAQVMRLHAPISSLVVDPNRSVLVVGTGDGQIFKVPVDVEVPPEADKDEKEEAVEQQTKLEYKVVRGESIGNDVSGGITLCSKFATMGVRKISSKAKASLTFLMVGSHLGVLRFWRHNTVSVDGQGGYGIRRSQPRMMKEIMALQLKSQSSGESGRAITAVEVIPWKSHTLILYMGTSSGVVEIWKLEAVENDEDDMRESVLEYESKLVEDDEGSCVVRIESAFQLKSKVFQSAVSAFSVLDLGGSNAADAETRILTSSASEPFVYVFSVIRENQLVLNQVLSVVDLKGNVPLCMAAVDDCIATFATSQTMVRYPVNATALTEQANTLQACGDIHLLAASATARMVVVVDNSGRAWCLGLDSAGDPHPLDHPDLVCALAFAPNGDLFLTGCINGAIVVWKVDSESGELYQANMVSLHSSAVISLSFSPNSTSVFTSSVDGSSFVLAVSKLSVKHASKGAVARAMLTKNEQGLYSLGDALDGDDSGLALQEHMAMEQEKELRAAHKFKCMGISAAVQEIQHRLSILISQNAERSEIEQLSLEDFVIDVEKKNLLEVHNRDQVKRLKEKYFLRQKWLELLAARLKNLTWDTARETAVTLKPFIGMVDVDPIEAEGVTSFPITHLTQHEEMMLAKLKRLRAVEIRCMKRSSETGNIRHIRGSPFFRCAWAVTLKGCPPDVSWIVNDAQCWPLQKPLEEIQGTSAPSVAGATTGGGKAGGNNNVDLEPAGGAEDDEEGSVLSHEDYYDIDEQELLNLIYAPETVRTIVQKRNQILFLKEIVNRIKQRFNQLFDQLQREKEDAMQFIATRNERIVAILEELHQNEKVWTPVWFNVEKRGSAIEVAADEMISKPYESEEAREARIREAEERALRQQSDEQTLERERALVDMMHGTLEIKRDVFAEALLLQRPPWMDTLTPSEMTDAQLKEYETYQNKLRELQEEQAHYRKTLEQEMKKLKVEINEGCKAFNDKLEGLNRLKVLANKEVLAQEIYIVKISLSMVKSDQLRATCKRNDLRLHELRKERADVKARNEKVNRSSEELKGRIASVQEEEKALDKTFRRDLQNLCNNTFDQESLKVFTALYRKRIYPRGGFATSIENFGDQSEVDASASASHRFRRSHKDASSSRRAGKTNNTSRRGGDMNATKNAKNRLRSSNRNVSSSAMGGKDTTAANLGPMQQAAQALLNTETDNISAIKEKDPYFEAITAKQKTKKMTEAQIPLLNPLSMELDCPEGFVVDQFSWSKLQELRNARIEKEIEAKLLAIDQAEVRSKIAMLELEESKVNGLVNETRNSRDATMVQLHNTETNLDIMISLLQGQDEVDRDAVATDYINALLFPVDVIGKYNARIKELGSEKIAILAKTKIFRRKINLISWEAKHQGLQAKHYEAYYTDLQLFRVTRDLQKVILDGENANNQKDRVEKVSNRKDFLQKDYQTKINQELKTLMQLKRSIQEKEQESKHLEGSIAQLVAEVQQSENIKFSRVQASGGEGLASTVALKKMKKVVQRRKLVDLARVQAEEIELLRQELDRMRQRTFPSFVKATKKRLMNAPF